MRSGDVREDRKWEVERTDPREWRDAAGRRTEECDYADGYLRR